MAMTSASVQTIAAPASTPVASTPALARAGLWTIFAGHFLATWGTQWDIQWHLTIGRDSFWIAPHVLTYTGVTVIVLASFGVLAWMTAHGGELGGSAVRVFGVSGSAGYHLATWGIALTVAAAPIDDLWHRLFGLDVTLWSPPHLLGLLGGILNAAACWVIARESYPAGRPARLVALVVAGALVYGAIAVGMQPGIRIAYLHGGLGFFTYPLLAALLGPLPLIITARLSRLRLAPLLVIAGVLVLGTIGAQIARAGFAWTKPTSFLAEEIAKDPTSPIAVSHEIARKNGTTPRAGNPMLIVLSLVAAGAMVAVDARRRATLAALAFGLTLLVGVSVLLARLPAFTHALPSTIDAAAAVALTALAALAAGAIARAVPPTPS